MVTDRIIRPYDGEPFGVDNGAFICYSNNKPWVADDFLKVVHIVEGVGHLPYMAVTPDIVCGGHKSLMFSNEWIQRSELDNGFPWYLAVQNGMTFMEVEDAITALPYSGVFVGGDDYFKKQTSPEWVELAHRYGLPAHIGRMGTPKKVRWANDIGADSCDSTFPLWVKKRIKRVAWAINMMNKTKATTLF